MAIGSSRPWTDHEKNVWSRLRATISSLVSRWVAESTAMAGSVSLGADRGTWRGRSRDCRRCDRPERPGLRTCDGAAGRTRPRREQRRGCGLVRARSRLPARLLVLLASRLLGVAGRLLDALHGLG